MSFLKRIDHAKAGGVGDLFIAQGIMDLIPAVCDYLTLDAYEDGVKRTRASLMAFVETGVVKVCLNDRDQGMTLWRSGPSIEDCLVALETAIVSGAADWRRSAGGPVRKAGGKR